MSISIGLASVSQDQAPSHNGPQSLLLFSRHTGSTEGRRTSRQTRPGAGQCWRQEVVFSEGGGNETPKPPLTAGKVVGATPKPGRILQYMYSELHTARTDSHWCYASCIAQFPQRWCCLMPGLHICSTIHCVSGQRVM